MRFRPNVFFIGCLLSGICFFTLHSFSTSIAATEGQAEIIDFLFHPGVLYDGNYSQEVLLEAADSLDSSEMVDLGSTFFFGNTWNEENVKDMKQSAYWLNRAAENGKNGAYNALGLAYLFSGDKHW